VVVVGVPPALLSDIVVRLLFNPGFVDPHAVTAPYP
jgi:hypothetical protein